jgi:hypothetical protein
MNKIGMCSAAVQQAILTAKLDHQATGRSRGLSELLAILSATVPDFAALVSGAGPGGVFSMPARGRVQAVPGLFTQPKLQAGSKDSVGAVHPVLHPNGNTGGHHSVAMIASRDTRFCPATTLRIEFNVPSRRRL